MSEETQNTPETEADESTLPQEETSEEIKKEPRSQDLYELDSMVDTLEEKLDKTLRAYADAENRAKRAEKDRGDALKYGVTKIAKDLLDVADNFSRALATIPEDKKEPLKDLITGIELTEKSLEQIFQRHDIQKVDTDIPFDPQIHEAITKIPDPNKKAGDIIDTIRVGYKIGDRLLRAAQVVVCA